MQTGNVPAVRSGTSLVAKFADKYSIEPNKLMSVLKATCFRQAPSKNGQAAEVTDEQMAALLVVADQYGLNPFTREIYAFPDKAKGIVPIVGVDGWARIINEHPALDGFEFRESEKIVNADDDAKPCPEWMEIIIHRKDRRHPIIVREYLDECYRPAFKGRGDRGDYTVAGPWQSHPKRFLRHKALIQGARIAFGFAGVYDEDEGERIAQARAVDMNMGMASAIDVSPALDTSRFDQLALDVAADPHFVSFLTETAKANGMTMEQVKVEAAKDFDRFTQMFRDHAAKNAPKAKKEKPKPAPAEPEAPAQDVREFYPCPNLLHEDGAMMNVVVSKCATCPEIDGCPSHKE